MSLSFLDVIEYPDDELKISGVPEDTEFVYVPTSYLDGLVNHLGIRFGYVINRYGIDDPKDIDVLSGVEGDCLHEKAANFLTSCYHTPVLRFDDTILFGKTEKSYWALWYDNDVSDSCIANISKDHFKDFVEFVDAWMKDLADNYENWRHSPDEKPKFFMFTPRGWIRSGFNSAFPPKDTEEFANMKDLYAKYASGDPDVPFVKFREALDKFMEKSK